tara:strand:+ start:281 stop:571 length:291 start_codon:yes stop_codon:yes gene_type:complete
MPIKKNAAKATASQKKPAPVKKPSTPSATELLEARIAELEKYVKKLEGQCHSCCAELDAVKASTGNSSDSRVDLLLSLVRESHSYEALRLKIKKSL